MKRRDALKALLGIALGAGAVAAEAQPYGPRRYGPPPRRPYGAPPPPPPGYRHHGLGPVHYDHRGRPFRRDRYGNRVYVDRYGRPLRRYGY